MTKCLLFAYQRDEWNPQRHGDKVKCGHRVSEAAILSDRRSIDLILL